MLSPVLLLHISAGIVGLLSGAAAMCFRKGSPRHRWSGNVFVISMLCLSASGAYVGFMRQQTLNGMMGVLTFYLVTTAWLTAKRRDGEVATLDWWALLVPLAVGAILVVLGFDTANSETGTKGGYSPAEYFIFGSIALLFAAGDVRMLLRGGVFGSQRLARHLTRMCFALFIAAGSFFLGQPQVFPEGLRNTNLLFIPSLLPLVLLLFWRLRVRTAIAYRGRPTPTTAEMDSLQA